MFTLITVTGDSKKRKDGRGVRVYKLPVGYNVLYVGDGTLEAQTLPLCNIFM